jgi:hypothetical protein
MLDADMLALPLGAAGLLLLAGGYALSRRTRGRPLN